MIEVVILDYLESKLNQPIGLEKPEPIVKEYVTFEKISGSEVNHLHTSTIAIQSYSESLYAAALLNEKVKAALKQITEIDVVASISLNNDYNFTDPTTKEYRYQAVFEIKHY